MRSRRPAAVAAMVLCMSFGGGLASAQIPPLPPVPAPPPPEQAQPVFEIVAPTVFPACGTAILGIFLAASQAAGLPGATGIDDPAFRELSSNLAAGIYGVSTPLFAICGAVPAPPTQLTCLLDVQAQNAMSFATGQVAGAAVPLGLRPVGGAVEQVIVIEDKLPPPANAQGLGTAAVGTLGCAAAAGLPPQPPIPEDPQPQPNPLPQIPPAPFFPAVPGVPGTSPQVLTAPGTVAAPPPATTLSGAAVVYGVVWLLPLLLLGLGGYFGGALTRDIEIPAAAG